jgi:hypothetical protein
MLTDETPNNGIKNDNIQQDNTQHLGAEVLSLQ